MKAIFLIATLSAFAMNVVSQKQTFSVVSFTVPKGWQQKQNDGSVQLLARDSKTNGYVMAIITKATPSTASANENFNNQWTAAIKTQIQLDSEPVMQPPSNGNGWEIIMGSANYTDNSSKGKVSMLSATGGGQTVTVVIMINAQQYEKDITAFLQSLELSKQLQNVAGNIIGSPGSGNANAMSVVGLWVDYLSETSGYMNGMPLYAAGYVRHEYFLNADGTYLFRAKNWPASMKKILFAYETGTWSVNGNQLTITPKQGKAE